MKLLVSILLSVFVISAAATPSTPMLQQDAVMAELDAQLLRANPVFASKDPLVREFLIGCLRYMGVDITKPLLFADVWACKKSHDRL